MSDINQSLFSQFWKSFVSEFIDVQKSILLVQDEVKDYHPIVQRSLCKLGWTYNKDLFHHYSLGRKNEQPDFFIKYDGNKGISLEVKLPNNVMSDENKDQLIEYMRLSDSNIGIYIGECVRVFYRPSLEKELKIILDAAFVEEDIEGGIFAELFFCGTFNIESLKRNLNKYYEVERLIDEKKVSEIPERINEPIPNEWIVDRYNKRAFHLQMKPSLSKEKQEHSKIRTSTTSRTQPISAIVQGNMKSERPCQILLSVPESIKDILDNGVKQMKRQGKLPKEDCTIKYASRIWLLKGLLQEGLITEGQFKEASDLPSSYGWNPQDRKK